MEENKNVEVDVVEEVIENGKVKINESHQNAVFIDDGKDDVIVTGIEPEIDGISHESVLSNSASEDNVNAFDDDECHRNVTSATGVTEEGLGVIKDVLNSFRKDHKK
ncbi:hypothetical protein [Mycoplasma sp. P36-A1]|uniref:hypothetical protein n=1 Tax=Mycoplasma sp. P36-A1 TaxID=3252900 RepID=UPI003C2F946F